MSTRPSATYRPMNAGRRARRAAIERCRAPQNPIVSRRGKSNAVRLGARQAIQRGTRRIAETPVIGVNTRGIAAGGDTSARREPMTRLSTFIRDNSEAILSEWEAFARSLPVGRSMDMAALRDHAK